MTNTTTLNIELSSDLKAAPCNTPLLIAYQDGTTRQDMRATDDWHWPHKDAVGWALMPGVDIWQLKNGHLPEWAREHVTLDRWKRVCGSIEACVYFLYGDYVCVSVCKSCDSEGFVCYLGDETLQGGLSAASAIKKAEALILALLAFAPETTPEQASV